MHAVSLRHTAIAIDLPGFGGSAPAPAGETTMEMFAMACECLCNKVAPGKPWVLCGSSLGGYVVFEMFRRARRLQTLQIGGLVLVNTRAVADTPEQKASRNQLIERIEGGDTDFIPDFYLPKMLTTEASDETRRRVRHWMKAPGEEGLLGGLHALLHREDSVSTLQQIDVPTLVIAGSEDPISPPDEMRAMAAKIQGARFEVIEGASHLSHVEKPDEFMKVLVEWLEPFVIHEEEDFETPEADADTDGAHNTIQAPGDGSHPAS